MLLNKLGSCSYGNDFEPSCELMNIHKTINFRKGDQVLGI